MTSTASTANTSKSTKSLEASAAPATEPMPVIAETRVCKCGCGMEVGKKSTYRPGHDAKHISWLIAQIKVGATTLTAEMHTKKGLSPALTDKLTKAYNKQLAPIITEVKANRKAYLAQVAKEQAAEAQQ